MPRKSGYCLAMNRDEKLTRPTGLPPALRILQNNRRVVCPSEPGGGTWIALNDAGVTLALINWYSVSDRAQASPVSRGEVIKATCAACNLNSVETLLNDLPLNRINPFRLIGIFASSTEIAEWRWNLKSLERKIPAWKTQQWISSGFDEFSAQRERSRSFHKALRQSSAGCLDWLRRLHRSHTPEKGPFSTCMHRIDAATVSYTEVAVQDSRASLRHCTGAPCQHLLESTSSTTIPQLDAPTCAMKFASSYQLRIPVHEHIGVCLKSYRIGEGL